MNNQYNFGAPDSMAIRILEEAKLAPDSMTDGIPEKVAFNLSVTPGAVVGTLVGAGVFSKRQKELKDRQRIIANSPGRQGVTPAKKETPSVKGDYYSQATNLAKYLRVVFTPVSAIYLVKNGTKDVAIETIDIEKMDDTMHHAWQNKDEEFFKRMLLNKMMMDISLAERLFARNAIANQNLINQSLSHRNGMTKTAVFACDSIDEYVDSVLAMRTLYENVGCDEKVARLLEKNAGGAITVSVGFDECPEKYAALGKPQEVFSINSSTKSIRGLKKRLENPSYLKKNVDIGFLPDRVTFTVDNVLVTTMSVFDMNSEGFRAFQNQDTKYFKRLFSKSVKTRGYQKTAAEDDEPAKLLRVPKATAFRMGEVSPVVYDKILTNKYGKSWTDIDLAAVIKMIEVDFKLSESGIPDIPLNKIMSIHACFSQETLNAITNPFAFEKIIRSFNDLPIDFLRSETEGLGVNEIVYGIYTYERLFARNGDDVYALFSDEILQYLAELLYNQDVVVLLPMREDAPDGYLEFYSDINRRILTMLESKNALDSMDATFESLEEKKAYKGMLYQNEILQPLALEVLTAIRSGELSKDLTHEYIEQICEKHELDINKENLLRRQLQMNLDVDTFMEGKISALNAQIALYSL